MDFREFDEKDLRQKTVVPLLKAMGFKDVIEYHGSMEKGKDIVCWKEDELKGRIYFAVILKKGDIHGAVGKSGSASEVLYQVRQAFNSSYRDIYGLAEVKIHRCLVITSGSIGSTAIESISGDIGAYNLDRMLDFIDGDKLEHLLDAFLPKTFGRIGNVVYEYEQQHNVYYFNLNPKANPDGGPPCIRTEQLQSDGSFLINVDYNFDNTVYGIEVIDWRESGSFGKHELTPEEIMEEIVAFEEDDDDNEDNEGDGHEEFLEEDTDWK